MVNAQGDHKKIQSKFWYGWLVYAAFFMRGPEFDSHGGRQIDCYPFLRYTFTGPRISL